MVVASPFVHSSCEMPATTASGLMSIHAGTIRIHTTPCGSVILQGMTLTRSCPVTAELTLSLRAPGIRRTHRMSSMHQQPNGTRRRARRMHSQLGTVTTLRWLHRQTHGWTSPGRLGTTSAGRLRLPNIKMFHSPKSKLSLMMEPMASRKPLRRRHQMTSSQLHLA